MTADERDATDDRRRRRQRPRKPPKGRRWARSPGSSSSSRRRRRGTAYALGGEITIGRDPSSTIIVDDDTFVSQRHAKIYDVEGQAMVEDLGSTNGSFHNGNRLHRRPAAPPG